MPVGHILNFGGGFSNAVNQIVRKLREHDLYCLFQEGVDFDEIHHMVSTLMRPDDLDFQLSNLDRLQLFCELKELAEPDQLD